MEQTEQSLGATSVALGDTRPDNTSAIIALQRAAATPSELTKQNLYKSVEELFRIYIEFMGEYYGKRTVDMPTSEERKADFQMLGIEPPATMPQEFDFSILKENPMKLKLDVGASSYYSEIAAMQTLDNMLASGNITKLQYVERLPDSYMPAKRELEEEFRQELEQQMAMQGMMGGGPAPAPGGAPEGEMTAQAGSMVPDVAGGGGYGQLQRAINAGQEF